MLRRAMRTSIRIDLRMVAPSLVTDTLPPRSDDCRILSMPLGPSDVFTRSATASAPMMEDCERERAGWVHAQGTRIG